jgi:hypothetical protein
MLLRFERSNDQHLKTFFAVSFVIVPPLGG